MSKQKLRRITINNLVYLWKRGHYHLKEFQYSTCADRLVVYLEDYKQSPLILHFRLEDNQLSSNHLKDGDWFMESGCLIRKDRVISLNRPAVFSKLISYYLRREWQPATDKKALEIFDALLLLDHLELPEAVS